MLRNLTRDLLESGRLQLAQKLTFYDKMRVYYQNLSPELAIAMGRSMKEFLLHCMTVRGSYRSNYYSRRVSDVYLIVDLGLPPDAAQLDQAFVMDIFDQAFGPQTVRGHGDRQSAFDLEWRRNITKAKMVEIAFDTIQWSEATELPNDRCHPGHQPYIYDLGRNYSYSYRPASTQEASNRHVINRCGCVLAHLPRPVARPTLQTTFTVAILIRTKLKASSDASTALARSRCQSRASGGVRHHVSEALQSLHLSAAVVGDALASNQLPAALDDGPVAELGETTCEQGAASIVSTKGEKLTVTLEALMSRIGGLVLALSGLTMAFLIELGRISLPV
uniref:Nucleotidyltransferase n=1 Tax=Macrostomum lignano TaxID=282301 RepID=A0A1I8FPL4_9PLAT